jgi:hypothetical protein
MQSETQASPKNVLLVLLAQLLHLLLRVFS